MPSRIHLFKKPALPIAINSNKYESVAAEVSEPGVLNEGKINSKIEAVEY
jgi:hypothetical protein